MSLQSEPPCEIKNFTDFLETCLGQKVVDYSVKRLTKPGENYGSIMLSVAVKVIDENNKHSEKHIVAKTVVKNPYLVKLFQPSVSFVKEANFYSDVIPAMKYFEESMNVPEEERINTFIRCIGSRLSLNPNADCADGDAVLILENIKLLNFENADQQTGFDFDESLAIIKQLAKFHSICIAMKHLQPELFNSKIRPHANDIYANHKDDGSAIVENICNGIRYIENLDEKLQDDIAKLSKAHFIRNTTGVANAANLDDAYTTLIHKDFWSTNIMIRKDKSIDVRIYDFQMYRLASFACDLLLFLFTSIRSTDLTRHFKLFINFYHIEFIKILRYLHCPLDEYQFKKMWNEIKRIAKTPPTFIFILYIVKIIHLRSGAPSSYDEIPINMFIKDGKPSKSTLDQWKLIIELFNENGFFQNE